MKTQLKTALSAVAIASLAACGGGGGDSGSTVPTGFNACSIDVAGYGAAVGVSVAPGTTAVVTTSLTCDALKASIESSIASSRAELVRLQGLVTTADGRVAAAVTAGQLATDAKQTELNAANLRAVQAEAAAARADVALQEAVLARTAAQALAVQAQADLGGAQTAAQTAAATAAVAQAEAAAAVAARAIAEATAAQAVADALVAQTAAATAQAQIVTLNAQIVVLQAQVAAGGGNAALLVQIASLQADLAAAVLNTQTQVAALTAELRAARAAGDVNVAQIAMLTARVAELQAQLAAAGSGGNSTGLPFCNGTPSPIVASTTFPGAGTACVVSYADQKAVADAVAAAAAAAKFEGVFASLTTLVVAEVDGKVWTFSEAGPTDAFMHQVSASTGTTFSANGVSLSYTHASTPMSGTYSPNTSANVTFSGATRSLSFLSAGFTVPIGQMGGQDFYSGNHDLAINVSAGNSFTGSSVNKSSTGAPTGTSCAFTGAFTDTPYAYKKVSITWGANCAVQPGTVGSGVFAQFNGNYVMVTNQAGQFADVGFVSYFNPTWSVGTARPATAMTDRARALQASRIGSR